MLACVFKHASWKHTEDLAVLGEAIYERSEALSIAEAGAHCLYARFTGDHDCAALVSFLLMMRKRRSAASASHGSVTSSRSVLAGDIWLLVAWTSRVRMAYADEQMPSARTASAGSSALVIIASEVVLNTSRSTT